jgi:hypothetical protein
MYWVSENGNEGDAEWEEMERDDVEVTGGTGQ